MCYAGDGGQFMTLRMMAVFLVCIAGWVMIPSLRMGIYEEE